MTQLPERLSREVDFYRDGKAAITGHYAEGTGAPVAYMVNGRSEELADAIAHRYNAHTALVEAAEQIVATADAEPCCPFCLQYRKPNVLAPDDHGCTPECDVVALRAALDAAKETTR